MCGVDCGALTMGLDGLPSRRGKAAGPHYEKRLSAAFVKSAPPGRHTDGGGLYLEVDATGARRWLLRIVVQRKRRDLGLGSAKLVSLAEARTVAQEYRRIARTGGDPRANAKAAAKVFTTFRELAERVHANQIKPNNRNGKHVEQWLTTLGTYAFPAIGAKPIHTIRRADLIALLEPIWLIKQETARRVLQRMTTVFDYALAMDYLTEGSPVPGVRKALPPQKRKVIHFSAMPWEMVPGFMRALEEADGAGALALRFTILTAMRSGAVRKATWDEIQDSARLWHIPGPHMKGGEPFTVPLCPAAMAVLREAEAYRTGPRSPIFPSPKDAKKPLSENALLEVLARHGESFTVHGFRSSFRDWTETAASFPHEVKESALAHAIPNKTEAAYRRLDYLEQRMPLMDQWGAFLCDPDPEAEDAMESAIAKLSAVISR